MAIHHEFTFGTTRCRIHVTAHEGPGSRDVAYVANVFLSATGDDVVDHAGRPIELHRSTEQAALDAMIARVAFKFGPRT